MDCVRVGYFIPLNGPLNGHPPSMYYMSGVPQGSLLGPILVLVYINDLEEGVTGRILKFADDTKLFRKTKEIGDKRKLQGDIDKLDRWSKKWQMLFNFGKCKCLHTWPGNTGIDRE